jgi:asparagine synthase (glutamine-hydrolysing)
MCGIVGFLRPGGGNAGDNAAIIRTMANRLEHRGPDDQGAWLDATAGVALGHRRLSILDLSPAGHQPMVSSDGRYILVFNGECYNHLELRNRLGRSSGAWRGHSDTETLLACFEEWGIEKTLPRTVGMFAIGVWDRAQRRLTLARDRMGEKPLYYGWQGQTFVFGSQLDALCAHPDFVGTVDRDAVALFLRHGYVPGPHAIYTGMSKLPPGTYLTVGARAGECAETPTPFWSLVEVLERAHSHPFTGSIEEAVDELGSRLSRAVSLQRLSDVPLGAFLSGGIDSSTVVALMQQQSLEPVKTFTIGFNESGFNETHHARAVAEHLGTDHTELYITAEEAMGVIPQLPSIYDEPFGDSSAIPTTLLSRLARRSVSVSLSGDGGDELFYGYRGYFRAARLLRGLNRIPPPARFLSAQLADALRAAVVHPLLGAPAGVRMPQIERKLWRLAATLRADSMAALYRILVSHWDVPEDLVPGAVELPTVFVNSQAWPDGLDPERMLMYLDCASRLPEDMLAKVDRAAMSVSLETRVPMLDHRVVEFAQTLPIPMLDGPEGGKIVLRRLLGRYLPSAIFERPKQGFSVPMGSWLRGPLRGWAEDLLDPECVRAEGYFDVDLLQRRWREYLSGAANWEAHLWDVLMFQGWLHARPNLSDAIPRQTRPGDVRFELSEGGGWG